MGLWQMDHTRLDIAVDGQEVEQPCRPWLTTIMDADTRMIVGSRVSHESLLLGGGSGDDDEEDN